MVAQKLLGSVGEYAMLFLILMAVMSTGSAEVIAVASIVIYDVYQVIKSPNHLIMELIHVIRHTCPRSGRT